MEHTPDFTLLNELEHNQKKALISQKFLEYFFKHGMAKTIIDDVAKDLHMIELPPPKGGGFLRPRP
jgi:hypothetical protein